VCDTPLEEHERLSKFNSVVTQKIVNSRRPVATVVTSPMLFYLAFRGRCDEGRIVDVENPLQNEGNFGQLLRFRVEAVDTSLKFQIPMPLTSVRPRRTN
jgi:hypothetical protein